MPNNEDDPVVLGVFHGFGTTITTRRWCFLCLWALQILSGMKVNHEKDISGIDLHITTVSVHLNIKNHTNTKSIPTPREGHKEYSEGVESSKPENFQRLMDLTWSFDLDKGLEVDVSEASWHMLWNKTELGRQGNIIIIKVCIECKWLYFITTNIFLWVKQNNLITNTFLPLLFILSHAAWACLYGVKNVKFYKFGFCFILVCPQNMYTDWGLHFLQLVFCDLITHHMLGNERDCSQSKHLFCLIHKFKVHLTPNIIFAKLQTWSCSKSNLTFFARSEFFSSHSTTWNLICFVSWPSWWGAWVYSRFDIKNCFACTFTKS